LKDPGSQRSSRAPAPPAADELAAAAELEDLRSAIDAVDAEILDQLNRRAALVLRVGALKRALGQGIYRAARERELIASLQERNPGPFPSAALPAVFREIISASYALEEPLRVAFLGPEGTFSHLAVREIFGSQVEVLPVSTLPEVFSAVERGEVAHAVVPIENTTEGVVTQALDRLLESEVALCGEKLLRISHQLLSRSGRLEDVRRVVSHPQPLAQCRGWLERHLPGVPQAQAPSTAAAAQQAREDPGVAAIGSALGAEVFGLRTVQKNIEDRRDNTTRFLVLGGDPPPPSGNDLTLVAFTVRKAESGALHRLLAPFAEGGVNLTRIHARPLRGTPWEYVFFLELEGHSSDAQVRQAFDAAARRASSHRVLGSFPRAGSPAVDRGGAP